MRKDFFKKLKNPKLVLKHLKFLFYIVYIYSYYSLISFPNKILLNLYRKKEREQKNLISVLIPTYNSFDTLINRAIPSVLNQTYQNFEIIIVGDCCDNKLRKILERFNDNRIKFHNLAKRGVYPKDKFKKWQVAGVAPRNKALQLAKGKWIAPLDDDDEFSRDHLEILLKNALERNLEMVYGKIILKDKSGKIVGSKNLRRGDISHLSVLYSSKLNFLKYDIKSYRLDHPADWNLWKRMKDAGVRIGFVNKVVGKHF